MPHPEEARDLGPKRFTGILFVIVMAGLLTAPFFMRHRPYDYLLSLTGVIGCIHLYSLVLTKSSLVDPREVLPYRFWLRFQGTLLIIWFNVVVWAGLLKAFLPGDLRYWMLGIGLVLMALLTFFGSLADFAVMAAMKPVVEDYFGPRSQQQPSSTESGSIAAAILATVPFIADASAIAALIILMAGGKFDLSVLTAAALVLLLGLSILVRHRSALVGWATITIGLLALVGTIAYVAHLPLPFLPSSGPAPAPPCASPSPTRPPVFHTVEPPPVGTSTLIDNNIALSPGEGLDLDVHQTKPVGGLSGATGCIDLYLDQARVITVNSAHPELYPHTPSESEASGNALSHQCARIIAAQAGAVKSAPLTLRGSPSAYCFLTSEGRVGRIERPWLFGSSAGGKVLFTITVWE